MAVGSKRAGEISSWAARGLAALALMAASAGVAGAQDKAAAKSSAISARADEKAKLKACEKSLCTLLVSRKPDSGDLVCPLTKAWSRKTMKEGADSKIRWGFGAARCEVELKVPRRDVVATLAAAEGKLNLPSHTATCEVEREGGIERAFITLAPIVEFKEGKPRKVWINVTDVKGPGIIKGFVWTAAKLQDTTGIFHRQMIKAANQFITEECPKVAAAR